MAASNTPLSRFSCTDAENLYSDGIVRLPWGEAPDGAMRHISEVPSGLACGCKCPGCGTPLVAHKGSIQHHFAHKATAECRNAGQTALHKLAKEVLDRERRLLIPEIRADVDDQTVLDHPGGLYTFDDARLERRLGDIVPDVIVRKGDHELLVEIAVTHFCDEEKAGRIRHLGVAAIEIDLSALPRNPDPTTIRQAILTSAPRDWIYNPRLDQAESELRDRIARRREADRERERRRINHLVDTIVRASAEHGRMARDDETVRRVEDEGYASAIGITIPGDYCFRISRHRWQAWVLDAFVLGPARRDETWGPIHPMRVLKWIRKARLLRRELSFVDEATAAEVRSHLPDYQDPYAVVETYLQRLEALGILQRFGRDWDTSKAVTDWYREMARVSREREDRYADVARAVDAILRDVPADEKASFDFDEWLSIVQPQYDASFATAIDSGRDPWLRMGWALRKLERMMRSDGDTVEDLLALPLERARDREIERRRLRALEQQRAKEEAARREASERELRLRETAVALLGQDGAAWVDQPLSDGMTPKALARSGKDGSQRAFAALDYEARRREEDRASAALAQGRVEILEGKAMRTMPAEHVPLFMNAYHPKIRARPRDHAARSDKGLQDCLALLPVPGRR
jgi:hypothetical protein